MEAVHTLSIRIHQPRLWQDPSPREACGGMRPGAPEPLLAQHTGGLAGGGTPRALAEMASSYTSGEVVGLRMRDGACLRCAGCMGVG